MSCEVETQSVSFPLNRTALHVAIEYGHIDCIRVLLAHAHELAMVEDNEGVSPLQLAYFCGEKKIIHVMEVAVCTLTKGVRKQLLPTFFNGISPALQSSNDVIL